MKYKYLSISLFSIISFCLYVKYPWTSILSHILLIFHEYVTFRHTTTQIAVTLSAWALSISLFIVSALRNTLYSSKYNVIPIIVVGLISVLNEYYLIHFSDHSLDGVEDIIDSYNNQDIQSSEISRTQVAHTKTIWTFNNLSIESLNRENITNTLHLQGLQIIALGILMKFFPLADTFYCLLVTALLIGKNIRLMIEKYKTTRENRNECDINDIKKYLRSFKKVLEILSIEIFKRKDNRVINIKLLVDHVRIDEYERMLKEINSDIKNIIGIETITVEINTPSTIE